MTHLLTSGMAVAVCLALLSVAAQAAAPVGYTQYGSFSVMLSGPPSTLSFEAAERLESELSQFAPFSNVRLGDIKFDNKSKRNRFDVIISLAETA